MIFDANGRLLRRAAGFVFALVPADPAIDGTGTVAYGPTINTGESEDLEEASTKHERPRSARRATVARD